MTDRAIPSRYVACVRTDDPDREGWKMIICQRCASDLHTPPPHDIVGMLPSFKCERCARDCLDAKPSAKPSAPMMTNRRPDLDGDEPAADDYPNMYPSFT